MINTTFEKEKTTNLRLSIDFTSGKVNFKEVWHNDNGAQILVAIPSDVVMPEHPAPEDVMIQMLEGEVQFDLNGKIIRLGEGDFFLMDKGTLHSVHPYTDAKFLLTKIKP